MRKTIKSAAPPCLILAFAALVCGCQKSAAPAHASPAPAPEAVLKQAPPTPIEEKKEELGGKTWDPQWDLIVEKALPPEMLSAKAARAVASYCPRFRQQADADKRAFWAYVFQALAGAEAGLDPTTNVHHTEAAVDVKDSVSARPVRQEGLLQLTYADSDRYGCAFDWERDRRLPQRDLHKTILDPANNLQCGIKIMENQIIRQDKPLIVRTSYWSTLQPGTVSYQVFAKQMANVPAACGVGTRLVRRKRASR